MITPEDIKGNDEKSEQIRLFAWSAIAQKDYPQLKWLHAIPNANSHRMVAEGVRGGIADIFLPLPVQTSWEHSFAGLYIEMKIEARRNQKNGGLSDDQIAFGEYARQVGYKAVVCYGWLEARDAILGYLGSAKA